MTLFALHGFLGEPSDWNDLRDYLAKRGVQVKSISLEMFSWKSHRGVVDELFNLLENEQGPKFLLGYSFGGRLALHLFFSKQICDGLLIVSAHPGLSSLEEKTERFNKDLLWSNYFLNESWEELIKSWNRQSIFLDGSSASALFESRKEENHSREKLAKMMLVGSLGRQRDFRSSISSSSKPILWMVGQQDARYCNAVHSMMLSHPKSKITIVDHGGHRLPWEVPHFFCESVHSFIKSL